MDVFRGCRWTGTRAILAALCVGMVAPGCSDRAAPSAPPEPPPDEERPEIVANVSGEWIGAVLVDTPLLPAGRYQQMHIRRWFVLQDGASLLTNFGPGQVSGDSIVVTSGTGLPQLRARVDTTAGLARGESYEVVTLPEDWAGGMLLGPWHETHMLHEGVPAPHADLTGTWSWSWSSDAEVDVQHNPVDGIIIITGLHIGGAALPIHSPVTARGLFQQSGSSFELGPPQTGWIGGSVRGPDRIQLLQCWQLSRFYAGCTTSTLTR